MGDIVSSPDRGSMHPVRDGDGTVAWNTGGTVRRGGESMPDERMVAISEVELVDQDAVVDAIVEDVAAQWLLGSWSNQSGALFRKVL
jgi:hypothetical protein